jgi:hypothetical protein
VENSGDLERELEVYVTSDGLGRAAIVQLNNELFAIVMHWIPSPTLVAAGVIQRGGRTNWFNDNTPLSDLYEDREPEPGMYITVDDARRGISTLPYFSHAVLKSNVHSVIPRKPSS